MVAPSPLPVWDDAQLVARLAAGENDALGLIYDRHAPALFRVLGALLGNPADAEDALQETFVALATGRASKIRDLRAYLLVAARHQAFTILRRRKREGELEFPAEIAQNEADSPPHDFAELLARLPLEQREVIALKVWEELTFAEIAEVAQISPNTAMSRYRYGIEKLRLWCREEDFSG
ncbi:MAG TPA: RNA polymerase sigma factor [Abditibacterium sp.]|jgi:RNA polymerase sigma-70 factor (ECF subfamily)